MSTPLLELTAKAEDDLIAAGELPFVTVRQARDWLDVKGWRPRHGGGYERDGKFARMVSQQSKTSDRQMAVVVFE